MLNPWITRRSKQDVSDAWRALQVWIIPTSVIAALWLVMFIYNRYHKPPKKEKRVARQSYSQFKCASSRLDTGGSLLKSWETTHTIDTKTASGQGWYNLCIILGVTWVFSNVVYRLNEVGMIMEEQKALFIAAIRSGGSLAVSLGIIMSVYFVATYAFQLAIYYRLVRRKWEIIGQACLELAMFFIPLLWLRTRTDWSAMQRVAFGMQTAVLTMKMHSYIATNRHLRADHQHGGAGVDAGTSAERAANTPDSYDNDELQPNISNVPVDSLKSNKDDGESWICGITNNIRREWQKGELHHRKLNQTTRPRGDTAPGSTDKHAEEGSKSTSKDRHPPKGLWKKLFQSFGEHMVRNSEGQACWLSNTSYPNNINLRDFLQYSVSPTLVYEPNFPRTSKIRPGYIAEKFFMGAGLLLACNLVMDNYYYPVILQISKMDVFDAILQLLLPTMFSTLIAFFVTFECILNACAEITYFGDRDFYHDWWNSTTFAEFSRKWNRPVHEFLLRHVYIDSMRLRGLSQNTALYLTFIISIIAHEVVIWAALTPTYPPPILAVLSCCQFPLLAVMRLPFFKGKALGNFVFWAFLQFGLTMTIVLYARHYSSAMPDA